MGWDLNIKNPLRIKDTGTDHTPHKIAKQLPISQDEFGDLLKAEHEGGPRGCGDAMIAMLTQKGYDGFVYKNTFSNVGSTSWVIFVSNQVWSQFSDQPSVIRESFGR